MGRRKQQASARSATPQPPATSAGATARRNQRNHANVDVQNVQSVVDEDDDSMDVDVVYVKLKTSDGKFFNFTESEASCSSALKRMLESARNCANNQQNNHNGGQSGVKSGDRIPLQTIDSRVLANIQQWCKMHSYHNQSSVSSGYGNMTSYTMTSAEHERGQDPVNGIETDFRDQDERDVGLRQQQHMSNSWDMKFLASFSEIDLLRLTSAANFLDIKELYDSCCKFIANKWEVMSVDEIRRAYNIRNDFSYDEDIQIIQENKRIGLGE